MTGLHTEFAIDHGALLTFEQAGLTPREADSAASALAGLTAEEAARKMGISSSSVGNYRARAYRKLGVRNSRELIDRFGESRRSEAPQPQPRARLTALSLNESQVNVAECILAGRRHERLPQSSASPREQSTQTVQEFMLLSAFIRGTS